jgi:hypothetical protein
VSASTFISVSICWWKLLDRVLQREAQHGLADEDLVALDERPFGDFLAVHVGAVAAAQVRDAERTALWLELHRAVSGGDGGIREHDAHPQGIAADHEAAGWQRMPLADLGAVHDDQPACAGSVRFARNRRQCSRPSACWAAQPRGPSAHDSSTGQPRLHAAGRISAAPDPGKVVGVGQTR